MFNEKQHLKTRRDHFRTEMFTLKPADTLQIMRRTKERTRLPLLISRWRTRDVLWRIYVHNCLNTSDWDNALIE